MKLGSKHLHCFVSFIWGAPTRVEITFLKQLKARLLLPSLRILLGPTLRIPFLKKICSSAAPHLGFAAWLWFPSVARLSMQVQRILFCVVSSFI